MTTGSGFRVPGSAIALAIIGLAFGFDRTPIATAETQRRPDFASDVAPLLYAHCTTCHRPDTPSTFPLVSYDDARSRGKEIADAVASRRMPPWLAVSASGYVSLHGERRLQAKEITTIQNWIAAEMPSGDLKRAPWPPALPMGWTLGVPNLTMTFPRPMSMPPSSQDLTFNVVFDLNFPEDRWITGIDYRPSSSALLSHARFFALPASMVLGDEDVLPGFAGLPDGASPGKVSDELTAVDRALTPLAVWTPGVTPRTAPDGLAVRLPKGTNLVMQVTARASDTGAIEDGQIALYFTTARQTTPLTSLAVPSSLGIAAGIDLPPGAAKVVVKETFTLPIDVVAYGARGHAHELGRDLKMTATLPNRSIRGLLWIDRWDPRWQETFYFSEPVRLRKGTTLNVEITYDNSDGNPRQRSKPPRRVTWGPRLSDEVGGIELLIAVAPAADAAALAEARTAHFRRQLLRTVKGG